MVTTRTTKLHFGFIMLHYKLFFLFLFRAAETADALEDSDEEADYSKMDMVSLFKWFPFYWIGEAPIFTLQAQGRCYKMHYCVR